MAQIPSEAGAPDAGAPQPAPDAGAGPDNGGGKIAPLMQTIFKALGELEQLVAGDPGISQKVAGVKAQFESILDGGGEAEQGGPPAKSSGPMPMMAGAAKVRPAL